MNSLFLFNLYLFCGHNNYAKWLLLFFLITKSSIFVFFPPLIFRLYLTILGDIVCHNMSILLAHNVMPMTKPYNAQAYITSLLVKRGFREFHDNIKEKKTCFFPQGKTLYCQIKKERKKPKHPFPDLGRQMQKQPRDTPGCSAGQDNLLIANTAPVNPVVGSFDLQNEPIWFA